MVHGRATQQTCFIQFNVYVSQSFSFERIKYIKYIHECQGFTFYYKFLVLMIGY